MGDCPHHSDRRHSTVHEAGHAIAAVERDVPLLEVVIHRSPTGLPGRPEVLTGGWTHIDDTAVGTLDVTALLEFALAGQAAEMALLGDRVAGGSVEDIDNWRRWIGRTGVMTRDEIDDVVGEPVGDVLARMAHWASDRAGLVLRVAERLDQGERLDVEDLRRLMTG